MISAWTKNCKTDEDKQRLTQTIQNSKGALDRLSEILVEMELDLSNSELAARNYDSPNWAYKQAHVNGQKAMIRGIKTLINLDQKDVTNG